MKVFESKNLPVETTSTFSNLINNDLSLNEKIQLLIDSIDKIKSIPNGEMELIRILLTKFCGSVYFPRKGDNSERFDAIISFYEYKVVVEIEIPSTEILDAPRNLLDDYAVLNCRRASDYTVVPLVICWDLPNRRSDYWNVISDVYNVLGIKIKTITILYIALCYWTNSELDFRSDDFFLHYNEYSIKSAEQIFERFDIDINMLEGYFRPVK